MIYLPFDKRGLHYVCPRKQEDYITQVCIINEIDEGAEQQERMVAYKEVKWQSQKLQPKQNLQLLPNKAFTITDSPGNTLLVCLVGF